MGTASHPIGKGTSQSTVQVPDQRVRLLKNVTPQRESKMTATQLLMPAMPADSQTKPLSIIQDVSTPDSIFFVFDARITFATEYHNADLIETTMPKQILHGMTVEGDGLAGVAIKVWSASNDTQRIFRLNNVIRFQIPVQSRLATKPRFLGNNVKMWLAPEESKQSRRRVRVQDASGKREWITIWRKYATHGLEVDSTFDFYHAEASTSKKDGRGNVVATPLSICIWWYSAIAPVK